MENVKELKQKKVKDIVKRLGNMDNLLLVYYSHSTYYPVLNVINEYLKDIPNKKVLFIDKIAPEHNDLCFDEIIFYEDNLNYTRKLYNSLIQLNRDNKYIIYSLDIDILLKLENSKMNNITSIMEKENIDNVILYEYYDIKLNNSIIDLNDNTAIIGYNNEYFYYYNVQPSIWKLESFIKFNSDFDIRYRDAETQYIQMYCRHFFKIRNLNIYNETKKVNGLFNHQVCDTYLFIHISCFGNVVKDYDIKTPKNELEIYYLNEYNKIK